VTTTRPRRREGILVTDVLVLAAGILHIERTASSSSGVAIPAPLGAGVASGSRKSAAFLVEAIEGVGLEAVDDAGACGGDVDGGLGICAGPGAVRLASTVPSGPFSSLTAIDRSGAARPYCARSTAFSRPILVAFDPATSSTKRVMVGARSGALAGGFEVPRALALGER